MKIIGLTGSIAMGKSTTAQMFRTCGIPVSDSDAIVHALYRGEAVPEIEKQFPAAILEGQVDRKRLADDVLNNPGRMRLLESIIHPLVEKKRQQFLDHHRVAGARIIVVDIPLLFEIGGANLVDIIVVVSAPGSVQRTRAMSRPGMTEDKFNAILAKQFPDVEKRRQAHYIVDTGGGMESAMNQVRALIRAIA